MKKADVAKIDIVELASAIVFVIREDGSVGACVYYCLLNAATARDSCSKAMDKMDDEKTACKTRTGLHKYTKIFFGLNEWSSKVS